MTRKSLLSMFATLLVVIAALHAIRKPAFAHYRDGDDNTLKVDVAIDAATFSASNNNPADPGNPRRGSTFIVTGKIFPAGTIPAGITSFDPNQPGSIGTWVCRGVFLADFADVASGKARLTVDTTQLFLFPDDNNSLATEGLEGNVGVTTHRVVTGGTGVFDGASGVENQETIGLNQNGKGLFDLRFTINLRQSGSDEQR